MILLVLLAGAIVFLINNTAVQNYLAGRAADFLAQKLKTKVSVAHVRIDFLNHILVQGVYIEDQAHDTLLYAGEVQVRISDWFIFSKNPVIHYVGLSDAYARLYRKADSKEWNYAFIENAFASGAKDTSAAKPIEFDLKKIVLKNVRMHVDDSWGGQDLHFDAGGLTINTDKIDLDRKMIDIRDITVSNTDIFFRDYEAGHPSLPPVADTAEDTNFVAFNPAHWKISSRSLNLENCSFRMTMNDLVPVPDQFDQNHLAITKINLKVNTIAINGDTITGNVAGLSAHERCGIEIKKMRSKVSVSPVASICSDLYLETNHSKIGNYYAMNYREFPDFLEYIDSVVMVARLKDATVDFRDIAYFAPQLKSFPQLALSVSGTGKGTVADLGAQNMILADGNNVFRGNIKMKGLPDIYKTYITCTQAELITNGAGILRYFPVLKDSSEIAISQLKYAYFRGNYTGLVENFSVNGTIHSNLGNCSADIKMNIPGFDPDKAAYSGTAETDNLQLGTLLRQDLLGGLTMKEAISGNSFNPDHAQLKLNGMINELALNGYTYHNITTNGTLAKKQFNGTLLVDDPNLALEFDGGLNYSNKNVNIKATAHLLGSNFKAMHLTADTITASADFDLNCTGSNIDNFSGYAKLNNIDMRRNSRRLAIDSVLIISSGDSLSKTLTVQSNALLARIAGNYQLSKLSSSVQFYLSRYIPNYIRVPEKTAPDQDFTFKINTYGIDSILAVAYPLVRGFDNSSCSGSLNTTAKKLSLTAVVPAGSIGDFHLTNINLNGQGNLEALGLNTSIDNVSVGDSILNGSLSVTTTVGNDSVGFTIATTTPDTSTAITLNGLIVARKDSLFLTMLPSEFYLSQARWDVAGGGKVVYSKNFLQVAGLTLSSGLQKITASCGNGDQSLNIAVENLDLGQLGTWAGLAMYQPDGRVNGTLILDHLFDKLIASASLKATGVMLGTDTIGTINLAGDYNKAENLVSFDPSTGIYRDNSSVNISGKVSFDSNTHQKLDGKIEFRNAPVAWVSPFLIGLMSHLTGTLNGAVSFNGSSLQPEMDGNVLLKNAGFRVDYMGCNYTIPSANIHIDNKTISFGRVTAYDAYKNTAVLSGRFTHDLFRKMHMHLKVTSEKFEIMNLTSSDNNLFYGNLIARMDSFTIRGPFNNISLNAYNAAPAAKSRIYIPVISSASGDAGTYSFASFKTYGKSQDKLSRKNKDKIHINIDANCNPLVEMHIVLDPSSGDEIMARGDGRILLDIPPSNDISMNGIYTIENGQYSYSFKALRFARQFKLNSGSTISFNGPFSETTVKVNAVYNTRARLYDLLADADKSLVSVNELSDMQTPQQVNVNLHMNGYLNNLKLNYDIDLEDKHSQNTLAYQKLKIINADDRLELIQVASLLMISSFIPPDGIGGSAAITGAVNNISQIISSSTSQALTNIFNKLLKDKDLNVDVKYTNYNYNDQTLGGINRNAITAKVNKSYLNDRLLVEVGSTSDWGRPTSASSSSSAFNLTGDFRVQYQISQESNTRVNVFRTSDYDVTLDRDIIRSGIGINWHKSFDRLGDFFHGNRYAHKNMLLPPTEKTTDSTATGNEQ